LPRLAVSSKGLVLKKKVNGRFSWQDEYGPHPLELKLPFLRIMNFVPDSVI